MTKLLTAQRAIKYTRPPLAAYQVSAIFCPERYAEIEASTKSGKTYGCLAWIFEQAAMTGAPGRNYWWVAPVYSQSRMAFLRLKLALAEIKDLCRFNETDMTCTLPNGAVISFRSGEKPDNLYGEDVYACVIDEASRLRQDAFFAIRSTLTKTRGFLRIVGNVKGRKNWFYNLCRRAQAGERGHKYSKITARDAVAANVIKQAEVDDARTVLPANVFNELFMAEPSDDGGNPFGMDAIRNRIKNLQPGPAVAHGIDLAKSVDYTADIGLNSNGDACVVDRFQAPWMETVTRLQRNVGRTSAFVDSTGVGDPVLEALQRDHGSVNTNFQGYKFSSEKKQQLMEGLAVAIQQEKVAYTVEVARELENYEYEYVGKDGRQTGVRYSAPSGLHDDLVCALALAVACKNTGASLPVWRAVA